MFATPIFTSPIKTGLAVALTALLAAGCVPRDMPPQQVQSSNPSVTYMYRGDTELLHADQNAMAFCDNYQSIARTMSITDTNDGYKRVVFDCVAVQSAMAPQQSFNPNFNYTYTSDQELLDIVRSAVIHCINNGSKRAVSTVVTNPDGTKTVTSQCSAR